MCTTILDRLTGFLFLQVFHYPIFQIESVNLALQIVDGMLYEPGYTLQVSRAKFQPKKDFDHTKNRRMTNKEKKKFKKAQEGWVTILLNERSSFGAASADHIGFVCTRLANHMLVH